MHGKKALCLPGDLNRPNISSRFRACSGDAISPALRICIFCRQFVDKADKARAECAIKSIMCLAKRDCTCYAEAKQKNREDIQQCFI